MAILRRLPFSVLISVLIFHGVCGFKFFQERIPNGKLVPDPCMNGNLWPGVSHKGRDGGGPLNPFGEDFKNNDFLWDQCMCERDSDGDGKSNGEELGDPYCTWIMGESPSRTTGLSHPGVCDPYDSQDCQQRNNWQLCVEDEFICDSMKSDETQQLDLRIPPTKVPAVDTIYMCMMFDLPQDSKYQLIASESIVDNDNVLHHVTLYGCNGDASEMISTPQRCGMAVAGCRDFLAAWAVGAPKLCHGDKYGLPFGKDSVKRVLLQIHWTNVEKRENLFDSSGMRLYYTENLREYDAGILLTGQVLLQIPPKQEEVSVKGTCPQQCTRALTNSIYVTASTVHMHYLGVQASIRHMRDGAELRKLTDKLTTRYDKPTIQIYDPPVEVRPGDEIEIECVYRSKHQETDTYWGAATADEMCYVFFMYYPHEPDFTQCVAYRDEYSCPVANIKPDWQKLAENCTLWTFLTSPDVTTLLVELENTCDSSSGCTNDCQQVIDELYSYPCLDKSVAPLLERVVEGYYDIHPELLPKGTPTLTGPKLVKLLHVCDKDYNTENTYTYNDKHEDGSCVFLSEVHVDGSGESCQANQLFYLLVLISLMLFTY